MNKTLRYSLLSMLMVFCGLVSAQTVVFDFDTNYQTYFPNVKGVSSGTGASYVADGELNEDGVVTVDGVTVTVQASATDATTRNRIWASSPRLRMYNGNLTVAAPAGSKVTALEFTLSKNASSAKWDDNNTVNVGKWTKDGTTVTWGGAEAEAVVFTIAKNTQISKLTVTLNGEVTEPIEPDPTPGNGIFSEAFDASLGQFTIENKELGELTYVWSYDSYKYAKASAYKGAANVADASLVSPEIDLTGCKNVVLSFDHAVNKGAASGLSVEVRADGTSTTLEGISWPAGTSWDFQTSGNISLEKFVGKKIQIVFHYTSTTSVCPTWEVRNVLVDGEKGGSGINAISADKTADGAIFNLAGQRLEKPVKGINIINGKKVVVK
ncbi:MAG: choice-of-anchor J domain-containing protein [Prevotella sp.]|nr:choice-of-anchor J domain-containing protein [Prevotella sp.]